jgi:7-cyano-7-deazaguanine synthase
VLNLVSRGLPGNDGALRGGGGRVTFTGETDSVTPLSSTNQGAESTAVVLLSGGLDSTTVLAIAKSEGFALHALTFRYGQRHSGEIDAAKRIARRAGVREHHVVDIDLAQFGGSALTSDIPVPKDRDLSPSAPAAREIPVTYVPARNTIFLSYALAFAEVVGASNVFIGVNALDYSGYPDCRPEYIQAFEKMANLATRAGVEGRARLVIRTPLIALSKAAIIKLGTSLGVDYSRTTSCYDPGPNGEACGRCDACQLRLKGFSEAGLEDPISYATAKSATAGRAR